MTNDEREALIEKAAEAIFNQGDFPGEWSRFPDEVHEHWRRYARAALAVFEQAHTPTDDERLGLIDRATEAFARHEGAPTWQDDPKGRDAALRWHMRGFEDGLNARRTVQGEPTDGERGGCGCMTRQVRYVDGEWARELELIPCETHRRPVQAEPTDAQVLAAMNAQELSVRRQAGHRLAFNPAPDLSYYGLGNIEGMRAALRAALKEGDNRV